jgi:sensor histidine kinase YesM
LNSLYALSLEKSDQTPDAILQLSNMMRYVLTDAEKEKVPLENELHFLRNFFALQQLRFGKNIRLHFEESGDPKGLSIAPLMLIPFVENAFKHGVHTEEPSEISIFTRIAEQSIFLEVRNNKVTPQQRPEEQSGKGIANVRLRLHHLYPGKHVLKIDDNPKTYSVSLKIQLT